MSQGMQVHQQVDGLDNWTLCACHFPHANAPA
jgi:hypothetical protein